MNTAMNTIIPQGYIPFPCCNTEKQLFEKGARGRISCKCPRCKRYAIFDFDKGESYVAAAARGAVHKLNQTA